MRSVTQLSGEHARQQAAHGRSWPEADTTTATIISRMPSRDAFSRPSVRVTERHARANWYFLFVSLAFGSVCVAPALADGERAPSECTAFLGRWAGRWSQGFYGTQYIDVTDVSAQCIATLAYRPTEAPASTSYQVPIRDGAMQFDCNVPGSTCRLEINDGALRFTYTETSGFVNVGMFYKKSGVP